MNSFTDVATLRLEVVKRILDFLPLSDKKIARLVCNRWRYIVDEYGLVVVAFRPRLFRLKNCDDILPLLQSCRTVDRVEVKSCKIEMSNLPDKEIRFPCMFREVILEEKNSRSVVECFLQFGCDQAVSLSLLSGSLQRARCSVISGLFKEGHVPFANLTKLKIHTGEPFEAGDAVQEKHKDACSTFLEYARFSSLTELEVGMFPDERSELKYQKTIINFILFLAKHANTVKILSYGIYTKAGWNLQVDWTVVPSYLNLESCSVQTDYRMHPNQSFLPSLTNGGGGLKTIKILFNAWKVVTTESNGYVHAVRQILEANSETLQTVLLFICHFDANWLRPCTKLKSLTLGISRIRTGELQTDDYALFSLPSLEHINIFYLHTDTENQNPLALGYETLFISCGTSIKHLEITISESLFTDRRRELEINNWRWLNSCAYLKKLNLSEEMCHLSRNINAPVFQFMQELAIVGLGKESDTNYLSSAHWIVRCMPNLKILKVGPPVYSPFSHLTLDVIEIFLGMCRLQEIHLKAFDAHLRSIQEYCNSDSGTMQNVFRVITVDDKRDGKVMPELFGRRVIRRVC